MSYSGTGGPGSGHRPTGGASPYRDLLSGFAIAAPTGRFRTGRTGGQILWRFLIDRWKAAGWPVVSEDELAPPPWIDRNPAFAAVWYRRAYGCLERGLLVFDQSMAGRLRLLVSHLRTKPGVRILVVVQHLNEAFRFSHPVYEKLLRRNERTVLRAADRIIVHTAIERDLIVNRGVSPESISVIPIGVRPVGSRVDVRDLGSGESLRLLWVGGDFVRKGMGYLLEAMALCRPPRPRLTVVGKPENEQALSAARARVEALHLNDAVRFLGYVSGEDLDRHWASHDVFVQPSLHEGHGSALDEALLRGYPVAASDLPVFRERLEPGDVAFFPPGDATALASALEEMRDGAVRRRLAASAYRRAMSFPAWEDTLRGYDAVLERERALVRAR